MPVYDSAFFASLHGYAADSARVMVPLVLDLVHPRSVVDVGCGDGTWLAAFAAAGIADYMGIDGDYVRPEDLKIPADRFQPRDLSKPFSVPRKFDLAMSLEVGEHLPESSAAQFVSDLTSLGEVVLFSAAVPAQGGTNHVNERPPGYWAELFARLGYLACDCLRPRIWNDPKVAWWYAQNVALYAPPTWLDQRPDLKQFVTAQPLHLVHPTLLAWRDSQFQQADRPGVRAAARKLASAVRRRIRSDRS